MSVMDHSCLDLSATPLLSYLLRSYKQLYLCVLPVEKIISLITVVMMCCSDTQSRDVTKISSFQVNTSTKTKWEIKLLRISFGSIFLLFSYESSQGLHSKQPGEILPGPQLSRTALQSLLLWIPYPSMNIPVYLYIFL